jgi:hypothetical protein
MPKLLKIVLGIFAATIVIVLVALRVLIWWSHSTPRRPTNLSANAIWIPAPPVVLDLARSGNWLGCSVEGLHNRCLVTRSDGTVVYDGLFLPSEAIGPIPEERLRYSVKNTMYLWVYLNQSHTNVPVIHLQDGTVLLPVNGYDELKAWLERVGSKNP